MECLAVFILGVLALFALMIGMLAFGIFGVGAIVYGLAIISDRPGAGVAWLVLGLVILSAFGSVHRR